MFDVILIGAGVANLISSYVLSSYDKNLRLLILEQGQPIHKRFCDNLCKCNYCNVLSGVGGAGFFSDGKLTISPFSGFKLTNKLGVNNVQKIMNYVLNIFYSFSKDGKFCSITNKKLLSKIKESEFSLRLYPTVHFGTENIRKISHKLVSLLTQRSVQIVSNAKVNQIIVKDNGVLGVRVRNDVYEAKNIVVGVGRLGYEWLNLQLEDLGIKKLNSQSDIGVRVEIKKEFFEYYMRELYDLKLECNNCRTFCFCHEGYVILEKYDSFVAVNGHSFHSLKSENTNFAILCNTDDDVIKIAKRINFKGNLLLQSLKDFRSGVVTKNLGSAVPTLKKFIIGNIKDIFPFKIAYKLDNFFEKLEKLIPGLHSNAILYSPEIKFISKKVELNPKNFETKITGLYVVGDCSGYTQSIIGSGISGVLAAKSILKDI